MKKSNGKELCHGCVSIQADKFEERFTEKIPVWRVRADPNYGETVGVLEIKLH